MRSFFLQSLGAHLRYQDVPGDEPAVVYLHGLGCASSADFPEIVAQSVLVGRRSLLVDFLGFGFSDRPLDFDYSIVSHAQTIIALLDHLGLRRCDLVGHSMGGSVAIVLADLRPDLVFHLVVAEANLGPNGGVISPLIASYSEVEYIQEGHAMILDLINNEGSEGDDSAYTYVATFQASAPHALYRSSVALVQGSCPTWREIFIRLPLERVYIFGDLSLPNKYAVSLAGHGIRAINVPNAGHFMMYDNPVAFAHVISTAIGLA